MALGARPGHIISMASNAALRPIVAGAVAGLGLSFGVTLMLLSLCSAFVPISLPILAGIFGLLASIAVSPIIVPTARVLRNNPIDALRCE
jgi:ABC-type antimicrobial peptide transport system permease subunit